MLLGITVSVLCSVVTAASCVAQRKCKNVHFTVLLYYEFFVGVVLSSVLLGIKNFFLS
jgi:hypothetical protein